VGEVAEGVNVVSASSQLAKSNLKLGRVGWEHKELVLPGPKKAVDG